MIAAEHADPIERRDDGLVTVAHSGHAADHGRAMVAARTSGARELEGAVELRRADLPGAEVARRRVAIDEGTLALAYVRLHRGRPHRRIGGDHGDGLVERVGERPRLCGMLLREIFRDGEGTRRGRGPPGHGVRPGVGRRLGEAPGERRGGHRIAGEYRVHAAARQRVHFQRGARGTMLTSSGWRPSWRRIASNQRR